MEWCRIRTLLREMRRRYASLAYDGIIDWEFHVNFFWLRHREVITIVGDYKLSILPLQSCQFSLADFDKAGCSAKNGYGFKVSQIWFDFFLNSRQVLRKNCNPVDFCTILEFCGLIGGRFENSKYGFLQDGKPCVILSLNRLIGWEPTDYEGDSIPEQVRRRGFTIRENYKKNCFEC